MGRTTDGRMCQVADAPHFCVPYILRSDVTDKLEKVETCPT